MTRSVLIGATCALIGGASVAGAQTSHIFGNGGKHYVFDAMCHRITFVPPGVSDHEALNVVGQQVHCLVRRPDPFAQCVKKATLTVVEKADHGPGKPGDEIGAAAAVAKIQACAKAHL